MVLQNTRMKSSKELRENYPSNPIPFLPGVYSRSVCITNSKERLTYKSAILLAISITVNSRHLSR